MNRIQLVEEKLRELYIRQKNGITAEQIALELQVDRSNISRDLNQLVKEQKALKKKSRPVLFFPVEEEGFLSGNNFPFHSEKLKKPVIKERQLTPNTTRLDLFSVNNPTLLHQVEQGKAAVLYPPNGMNILILGETGVGKSMFAKLLHQYAVDIGKMAENAPFIQFNCADYANNPQLLVSQLFGTTKGAYTGADQQRDGLIYQADGGILFLDEIHRLPMEGQEMLFTFMDRGVFKPLGETEKEIAANVLLIGATTETQESLLKTFVRRMPVVIELPNLKSRSLEERSLLFDGFCNEEVEKIGVPVKISTNAIRAFLTYSCENNIGQFKGDIRLVFAKAYAKYLTGGQSEIVISSGDLPAYIMAGLLSGVEHRKLWGLMTDIKERFYAFDGKKDSVTSSFSSSIYETLHRRYQELEEKKMPVEDIQKTMEQDLQTYIEVHHITTGETQNNENLMSLIPRDVLVNLKEMVVLAEKRTGKKFSQQVKLSMMIHVFNLLERIKNHQTIQYDDLHYVTTDYPEMYQAARMCSYFLEHQFKVKIPVEELNYLVLFFNYDELSGAREENQVQVVVIAHGEMTASALAQTANTLLRNDGVWAIDAKLEKQPQEIYQELKKFIEERQIQGDILLLVDMGSLLNFAEALEKDFGIGSKSIPLVSTMHVLEASRKAMLGFSLEEVYRETLKVNQYGQNMIENPPLLEKEEIELSGGLEVNITERPKKPLAIITVCLTGEGTALTIQKILEKEIVLAENAIQLIPMNMVGKESIQSRIQELEEDFRIVCIVSSFRIQTQIPNFDLFDVIGSEGIEEIKRCVNEELTYRNMTATIEKYYALDDIEKIVTQIFVFNEEVERIVNKRFSCSQLIGLAFHIVGMILKEQKGEEIPVFIDENHVLEKEKDVVLRIHYLFATCFQKYFTTFLSESELNHVAYAYLQAAENN